VCLWVIVVLQISWKIPFFFMHSISFASLASPVFQMSLLMAIRSLSAFVPWHSHRKWSSDRPVSQYNFPFYVVTMCCSVIYCSEPGQDYFFWRVNSFRHYFDVFLLQPFQRFLCILARCQIGSKDFFVIFVVLLDEFDHFGQIFGEINVSIESLTLDSFYEGCKDTCKLSNRFSFYGVRSVFNIFCPETIHSCHVAV
jgi:hypothetical protein